MRLSRSGRNILLGHGVRESEATKGKSPSTVVSIYALCCRDAPLGGRGGARSESPAAMEGSAEVKRGGGSAAAAAAGAAAGPRQDIAVEASCAGGGASVAGDDAVANDGARATALRPCVSTMAMWKMCELCSSTDDANLAIFHPNEGSALLYGTIQVHPPPPPPLPLPAHCDCRYVEADAPAFAHACSPRGNCG